MGEGIRTLLIIIACAPILYWSFKVLTTYLLYKFAPPHEVVFEYKDEEGRVHSKVIDVSKDKNFYIAVSNVYQSAKKSRESVS
ncbi:hypothetical protein [Gayadomonas joobiniege]|uniref:hypothetical protein n=1 Tax=Gayadomonas joobiniege TaxID=1234606 RepID=UPI00036CF2F7|nr:hypothetical protein [Gayadomonas joobiniege]